MNGRIAYVAAKGEPFRIGEFPVVDPKAHQVRVRILAAGVCGSDVHQVKGAVPFPNRYPSAAGHEMIGEVDAIGSARPLDSLGRELHVGDKVVFAYFRPCGECPACAAGSPACPNRYAARGGLSVEDAPHFLGAFGDYYFILAEQWIYKVPEDLPVDIAAPANCAVSQALYALDRAGVKLGDSVVIQGLGGLGIYATAIARDMGAGRVIGVEAVKERLEIASRFGADDVIDVKAGTPEQRIAEVQRMTGGWGADVVIEMAGVPGVVPEGIQYLRPGGRYVMVGNIIAGASVEVVPETIVRRARELIGVVTYPKWVLPRAAGWLSRRRDAYPFGELVSETYSLERINDAFAPPDAANAKTRIGRVVIDMTR
jgi:L-iditol 2-dehydrogenase